jgi:predicted Holliday junction resolvase-like endonuclease
MGKEINFKFSWVIWAGVILAIFVIAIAIVSPMYSVWEQSMKGKAELSRADYNRQIAVVEAEAKLAAASKLADAEVARANGVAKSNAIIAGSITEPYLRYLWIAEVAGGNVDKTVVYVPTEANIPILEASRNLQLPTK